MCKIEDVIVFILLAVCSVSDWKRKTIPALLLVVLSFAVAVIALSCDVVSLSLRAGGVFLGLLFLFVSKVTKEAIGYGDSWLILLLGIFIGGKMIMEIVFMASFLAALFSLGYGLLRGWNRKNTLPFVPFLAMAYVGVVLL